MKPRTAPSSSKFLAQINRISAIGAKVIHDLLPFSTYESPSLRAVVSIPLGSEPWLGSVNPKLQMVVPLAVCCTYMGQDEYKKQQCFLKRDLFT